MDASIAVESRETYGIHSDADVVRIRQSVRTLAVTAKLSLVDQTKLVTAVSELARNTLVYGGGGRSPDARAGTSSRSSTRWSASCGCDGSA